MIGIPRQVEEAIRVLNGGGYEAFVVGGCVRDIHMGKVPKDWDITTSAKPDETMRIFDEYHCIETGLKHGTVTVVIDDMALEITTYRIDGEYTDHRRPETVTFTASLNEDLARRDFTMNAMAYHPKHGLQDPYNGLLSIQQKTIYCVGEPEKRFSEDALRIMRGLRFSSTLDFAIEPAVTNSMKKQAHWLSNVAKERIQQELTKLIVGKSCAKVLRENTDLFVSIFPDFKPMVGFEQKNPYHCYDVWEHSLCALDSAPPVPVLRYAALLHDAGKPACFTTDDAGIGHFYGHEKISCEIAQNLLQSLKMDNASIERIVCLIKYHDVPLTPRNKSIKRMLNKIGVEAFKQLIILARCDNNAKSPNSRKNPELFDAVEYTLDEILRKNECFSLKDLAVNGNDLIKIGYSGKNIGTALNYALDMVIKEQIANDKTMLIEEICKNCEK